VEEGGVPAPREPEGSGLIVDEEIATIVGSALPEWARAANDPHQENFERLVGVWELAGRGIAALSQGVPLARSLADYRMVVDKRTALTKQEIAGIEAAERDAALARAEVDSWLATINAMMLVASWGYLEAAVEDLTTAWLVNVPSSIETREVTRLQVRLGDIVGLSPGDLGTLVVRELQKSVKAEEAAGIGRMEAILRPIGLGGGFDEANRRLLLEASEIRNILVHRGGRVDRRFVDRCSWLGYRPGDNVTLSAQMVSAYVGACIYYILEVLNRIRARSPREAESATDTKDADG
jgi:hypothetical protein